MFRLDSFIKENNLFGKGLKLLSFEQSSAHTALKPQRLLDALWNRLSRL